MTTTYTRPSNSSEDHVRFLCGDTGSTFVLSDEEITDILALEGSTGTALPYYAAATCLESIQVRLSSSGLGVSEKTVDELKTKFGVGAADSKALERKVESLREQGSKLFMPEPQLFRVVVP